MLKIIDNDKEYSLGFGNCLMVQDRQDLEDIVQVDEDAFSPFEVKVFKFLLSEERGLI